MKILLDTHLLIWLAIDSERLPSRAREIVGDDANDLVFSTASIWEIAIKATLQRADFAVDARLLRRALLDNGYRELPVFGEHALAVLDLPRLHGDPFDRLLAAQAKTEGLALMTSDQLLARYPGQIIKV